MNLSLFFIERPIMTTLIAIAIAWSGIFAFLNLPIASLPQIEFPTIMVTAQLPGGNPQSMASTVAAPLERFLGSISGLTQMTSSSKLGQSRIILQFDLSKSIQVAANDVLAAINASISDLPKNLINLPSYWKANPADTPIMILALSSKKLSTGEIYDKASSILQQKIAQIEGVGQVLVTGSSLPAIRIEVNIDALNQAQIGLNQLATSIHAANVHSALGELLIDPHSSTNITHNGQMLELEDYENLIIAKKSHQVLRLKDLAKVRRSVEDLRNAGIFNNHPAIFLIVFKQAGANVIHTVDKIYEGLKRLETQLGPQIDLDIAIDRTKTIRATFIDVNLTLIIAMILVILVSYFFLSDLKSMIIPGIVVPLSLLGTFSIMKLLNYSLDNLSFMALIISTGFVVDDAVVVLENIVRHLDMGKTPKEAAVVGAAEVNFTVVSMSFSLIAVFIPILFMSGIIGRIFREFAVTLSVAILISMLISLSITPVLCATILKAPEKTKQEKSNKKTLLDYYRKSLTWALAHQKIILSITAVAIAANFALFLTINKGFFPQQDIGLINGSIQTDQSMSFQALRKKLSKLIAIAKTDPAVESVLGFVGGASNFSSGSMYISLKTKRSAEDTANSVIARLRKSFAIITGLSVYLQASQDLLIGGRQSNAQFQYTLTTENLNELSIWSKNLQDELKKSSVIIDVNSDQRDQGLETFLSIDREKAQYLGISNQLIDKTLYHAFGQSQVSTLYMPMNQYHVVMEAAPKYWQNPDALSKIYLVTEQGNRVPLSTIAQFEKNNTLLSVNHQGLFPAATLSFNLVPGTSLDQAVTEVSSAMETIKMPPSIKGSFQGTAQAFQSSLNSQNFLILGALITLYIVLGILYESVLHPLTILSTLPSAGVGALLALMLSHEPLSLIALIGIILLIGIVKKNAIMMVDFALIIQRTEKKSAQEAIFEAAILRFRPIMMTTAAAILGAVPLIIGFGLGSELRRPLGIAIFGGLLLSQIITIYTTPIIYVCLEELKLKLKFIRSRSPSKRPSPSS